MIVFVALSVVLALASIVYLVYAIVKPEKF